jgi:hypothetical protein
VEHACHNCGAAIEDNKSFCPHCKAPQIRVLAADNPTPTTLTGEISEPHIQTIQPHPTRIQWAHALPATALAALIASIFMVVPLSGFGLGMLTAGALAVILYRRRNPGIDLTAGMGAKLGAISGVMGFAIFGIVAGLGATFFDAGGQLRTSLLQAIEQSASRATEPQARQIFEFFKTPQGLAAVIVVSLAFIFVAFMVLSTLGGSLTAALLRRRAQK